MADKEFLISNIVDEKYELTSNIQRNEKSLDFIQTPSTPMRSRSPAPSLKRQILTLDRFQLNENENNFSKISAGLMEIMHDMLLTLPDSMVSEILNLLRFESFIMFTMDKNEEKRFGSFKIFLELIERSSSMLFYLTASLVSVAQTAAGVVSNVSATNSTTNQNAIAQSNLSNQQSYVATNKEFLIYAMCNQLNQFDQLDKRFAEFCIKLLINQPFSFDKIPDAQFLKSISTHITARLNYLYILISLMYSSRKNMKLCRDCLNFLKLLLELEIVKIDFLIAKAGLIQVLINLLKFFSDEKNLQKSKEKENVKDLPIFNDLKGFFCLMTRLLLRFVLKK